MSTGVHARVVEKSWQALEGTPMKRTAMVAIITLIIAVSRLSPIPLALGSIPRENNAEMEISKDKTESREEEAEEVVLTIERAKQELALAGCEEVEIEISSFFGLYGRILRVSVSCIKWRDENALR